MTVDIPPVQTRVEIGDAEHRVQEKKADRNTRVYLLSEICFVIHALDGHKRIYFGEAANYKRNVSQKADAKKSSIAKNL
jgi:hypothetical protein